MRACYDEVSCSYLHKNLLPLLMNTSLSLNIRSSAYDQLILTSEHYNFQNDLLEFLKHDKNVQLKAYIAGNLNKVLSDIQYKKENKKFVAAMEELLDENEMFLETFIHDRAVQSHFSSSTSSMILPFMPEELQKFGVNFEKSNLYQFYKLLPETFHTNLTLQLFNKVMNVLHIGGNFEGWENLIIIIQKTLHELNSKPLSLERINDVLKAISAALSQEDSETHNGYLGKNIEDNIKKIQDIYNIHSPQLKQYLSIYFDMFGNTLNFFTLEDIATLPSRMEDIYDFLDLLHEGFVYNSTRMIRVIEAHHQVPTLIGLPLNWTTDATLALSMRRGLKLKCNMEQVEIHANGFYQPSAALTFINRMILDFPTITKIGVQANSSAYTSTQWKTELHISQSQKIFRFGKPMKPQKILELFRTNQLIKHNDYIDIEDHDIERTSEAWCTDGTISSILGLQLCLDKSYPKVTHRIKPWALMAGWCKWQLVVNPIDKDTNSYDIEAVKFSMNKPKEIELKFSTSGSSEKQELFVSASTDVSTGEMKLEFKIPSLQNFILSAFKNNIIENNKISGYSSIVLLRLTEDFQYKLSYNHQDKTEKRRESSTIKNKSSNVKKVLTIIQEKLLTLETPYNNYKWDRKMYTSGENVKADELISYENLQPHAKWLGPILPPTFWENDSRAWLRIQMNWKAPTHQSGAVIRQTVCSVNTPQSVSEILANSLNMRGREQITINATKSLTSSKKLLAFLNFTYDFWSSGSGHFNAKEISLYNLTVSQRSWALQLQKTEEENNLLYEILFTKARMEKINGRNNDYVGWWSEDQKQNFNLKQEQVKFKANVKTEILDEEAIVDRYSSLTMGDVKGLNNKLITTDIALHLPFKKEESVTFLGYFILSRGPTTFRFQKNFVMTSSFHDLQLTSHSVYRVDSELSSLSHNSYFTQMTSGEKAFNIIEYKRSHQREKCLEIDFKHNINSHVFHLSTNASYKCHSSDLTLHTLILNMHTYSSHWDALNVKLDQIIEDINSELTEESVNVTHPLMIINVTADWRGVKKDHTKRVIFNSLSESVPCMELNIESLHNGINKIKLDIHNSMETILFYKRRISSDYQKVAINIKHSDVESKESDALILNGIIISENRRIWKGEVDMIAYQKVKYILEVVSEKFVNTLSTIAKDPQHPINEMLEPALKMSLYDYWKSLKKQLNENSDASWNAVKEILLTLEPFYLPTQKLLTNAFYKMMDLCTKAFFAVKDKSITIWAINYFNIPYYIQKGLINLPQNIGKLPYYFLPEDKTLKFSFNTGRFLDWGSFKESPSLSIQRIRRQFPFFFPEEESELKPHYQPAVDSKIAMIFGPLHVYTFDGLLYDVPPYASNDCAFLLAHDVHKSMFSVLSTDDAIHVLFPEMTISVNAKNEVFINGSEVPHALPIQSLNEKVVVKRGAIIDIWSPSLHIICDGKNLLCTLELSYWHSGGTIGLLGNADASLHNEYILPDGRIASDLREFVGQYELSGKSECKNFNLIHTAMHTDEQKQHCITELRNSCPLHKNLHKPFLESCLSDLKIGQSACYSASGLAALCYYKNGYGTSKCSASIQDSTKIKHKLEVVLIVNQLNSMSANDSKSSPYKGLESTIVAIDEKFRSNGYSSVLYTIVGYGGKGAHHQPSIYSVGSNPWIPLQIMLNNLLKTLEFNGMDEANDLDSLLYAAEVLSYDTFDSKIFLMFTEKDKQVADKATLEVIQSHLNKNGITLYTFSSYPMIEKGKKVFGVRADGLLFPSPKKEDEAYLDYPKGDIAKITSATKGSVFLYKFVRTNSPTSFFVEFAQEVWAKVRKEVHSCRQCRVVKSTWWYSFNECNILAC